MASMTPPSKTLISDPAFNRSIESHSSTHSADATSYGWRRTGTVGSEDVGTQTEHTSGSISGSGRVMLGEIRRRREDTIVDISLESMKYNGGIVYE